MHVGNYLDLVEKSERELTDAFFAVAERHGDEPEIASICKFLALWSVEDVATMKPLIERYGKQKEEATGNLIKALFHGPRAGGLGLVRDLHDLLLLAHQVHACWAILSQAAQALRDKEFKAICDLCSEHVRRQIAWLDTRVKLAAPQALVVA